MRKVAPDPIHHMHSGSSTTEGIFACVIAGETGNIAINATIIQAGDER